MGPHAGWTALIAATGLMLGCGGTSDVVTRYCEYGAVSTAQLDGCQSHATTDDVSRLDTHAASFARGDLTECLGDSGPFCEP